MGRPTINKPFIPTIEELRLGIVGYCQVRKPQRLECAAKTTICAAGYNILWTPPYTPEQIWGIGKNYVTKQSTSTNKLKDVVTSLCIGWYSINYLFDNKINNINIQSGLLRIIINKIIEHKQLVDCQRLFNHAIEQANTKFITICDGLDGTIDLLI
jgi:hypothetical protein